MNKNSRLLQKRSHFLPLILALSLSISIVGCSSSDIAATTTTAAKTQLLGLIDMQSWPPVDTTEPPFDMTNVNTFPGVLGGIVINVTWNAMQPNAPDPADPLASVNFTAVDSALDQIRTYNLAHPTTPLGAKLRIYAANHAPSWVKTLGGLQPITIYRNAQGCPGDSKTPAEPCPTTVGRFWTSSYIQAWRDFQAVVAARYDSEPLIRHVTVTSCTSQTDEPFVPTEDDPSAPSSSQAALVAAGFTDTLQQECLAGAIDDYSGWKNTLIDFTFNTYGNMNPNSNLEPNNPNKQDLPFSATQNKAFTVTVMNNCRTQLGERCVLGNHALNVPLRTADTTVYETMPKLGGPISFQTEGPTGFHCLWIEVIQQGIQLGAGSIELWPTAQYHGFMSFVPQPVSTPASPDSTGFKQLQQLASLFSTYTSPAQIVAPSPLPSCPGFY